MLCLSLLYCYIVYQHIKLNIIKYNKWWMDNNINNWIEMKYIWMKVYDVMVVICWRQNYFLGNTILTCKWVFK